MDSTQLAPLYDSIIQGAAVLITLGVGVGAAYIRSYVKKKIENDEIEKSVLQTVDVLNDSFRKTVLATSSDLKAKLADGKLTNDEVKALQDEIITQVAKNVEPAVLKRAEAHVGDVQTYLENKIAAKLQEVDKVTN